MFQYLRNKAAHMWILSRRRHAKGLDMAKARSGKRATAAEATDHTTADESARQPAQSARTAPVTQHAQPLQRAQPAQSARTDAADASGSEKPAELSTSETTDMSEDDIESRLSYADIQRRHSRPHVLGILVVVALVVLVVPYGIGRSLALNHTAQMTSLLGGFEPQGIALASWGVTTFMFVMLYMAFLDSATALWTTLFMVLLACEQFIAGFAMLKTRFWFTTYAVFGSASSCANAADVGIVTSVLGLGAFAVIYVLTLVLVRKDSPLNALTRDWVAMIVYFAIEVIAFAIAVLSGAGGLL